MAFKLIALFAFIAVASAIPLDYYQQPAPVYKAVAAAPVYKKLAYEHEAPAEYQFSYAVHDEHTGDIKAQQETRHGDQVQGHYELIDSDGYKRIVEYTADEHTGFNAVVHREPTNIQIPQPVQKVLAHAPLAKIAYAAPVAKLYNPVAPIAKLGYAAPVAKYAVPAVPAGVHVSYSGPGHQYAY